MTGLRPIETAPQNGTPVFLYPHGMVGHWDVGAEDWLLFRIPINKDLTIKDEPEFSMFYEVTAGCEWFEGPPTHWMPAPELADDKQEKTE